jgi:hypothetical protein
MGASRKVIDAAKIARGSRLIVRTELDMVLLLLHEATSTASPPQLMFQANLKQAAYQGHARAYEVRNC